MEYLHRNEFACPCCGKNNLDTDFLTQLRRARIFSAVPYTINSGCRCKEHNALVGGSETSSHLKGIAVDIKATNNFYRFHILKGLILVGFTRMGIRSDFIHADSDRAKVQDRAWMY